MFSLCIPTKDRYDNLINNLHKYIKNPLISEIIICDENGNDINKIKNIISKENLESKFKLFINEKPLGAFLNKINCCQRASNQWIALIDSAKFADINYFEYVKKKINDNKFSNETIIAPYYENETDRINYNKDIILTRKNILSFKIGKFLNTGNFVINKYIIDNLLLTDNIINFKDYGYDVMYFYTIILSQYVNLNIYIYHKLHYKHIVTKDSYILTSYNKFPTESKNTKNFLLNKLKELKEL